MSSYRYFPEGSEPPPIHAGTRIRAVAEPWRVDARGVHFFRQPVEASPEPTEPEPDGAEEDSRETFATKFAAGLVEMFARRFR